MTARMLLWGPGGLYPRLRKYYDAEIAKGTMCIAGVMQRKGAAMSLLPAEGETASAASPLAVDFVLVSDYAYFDRVREILQQKPGLPVARILDGKMFQISGFSLADYLEDRHLRGTLPAQKEFFFEDLASLNQPKEYRGPNHQIHMGTKSYLAKTRIAGQGTLSVGKYSSIAYGGEFQLGLNAFHDYHRAFTFDLCWFSWDTKDLRAPVEKRGQSGITIGNDVWVGRACHLKAAGRGHHLTIGDGAVIAANSVVVKDVPPYAIVGGNPAQIIKYRFSPQEIAGLERIRWWDWPEEQLYAAFHDLWDVSSFIKKYDRR